jgi:hypothetical protein
LDVDFNPDTLGNCSIGLLFPLSSEDFPTNYFNIAGFLIENLKVIISYLKPLNAIYKNLIGASSSSSQIPQNK